MHSGHASKKKSYRVSKAKKKKKKKKIPKTSGGRSGISSQKTKRRLETNLYCSCALHIIALRNRIGILGDRSIVFPCSPFSPLSASICRFFTPKEEGRVSMKERKARGEDECHDPPSPFAHTYKFLVDRTRICAQK